MDVCECEPYLSRTRNGSDVLLSSFAYLHTYVSNACAGSKGGFKDSKERGLTNIMQIGQLTCGMGLEWMGIRFHASKATAPMKGFVLRKTVKPSSIKFVYPCIQYIILYIFLGN
jgi:hypothetical protein